MHNSKAKPESIKLLSLNVRDLSNFRKRRAIFSWCRKQKADLILLQETHSTAERQDQWRKEWGASVLFSHGSTECVAILIRNRLNITIQLSETSSDVIVIKAIDNKIHTIANIYGPNKDAEAVKFYRNLSKLLRNDEFGNEENIIIGGDYNCPQNEFSLHDIWRLKNPTLQSFTWSCIINNGTLSASFEINRGVRQGHPLSPYLFIITVELLAVAIRSCSEIKGIKIDSKEFKMVQYADDLTAFVSDSRSAQYLFKLLDQFEKCSGLKVNYTKTEAMWIGSSRNNTETPLALKWCKTVKAFGVHFSYNNEESVQKNFYDKLRGIKYQIRLWSWRGLSLFGKVTIIKSLLLPKVLYINISSILPSPLEFIKAFQTIIFNFLWKGPDKIARTAVTNDFEFGGLNCHSDFHGSEDF